MESISLTNKNISPSLPVANDLHIILLPDKAIWGILEDLQPAEDGLILVKVSGMFCQVDEELLKDLDGLIGRVVSILHLDGQWSAREGIRRADLV